MKEGNVMKKSEQIEINNCIMQTISDFNEYLSSHELTDPKRLRSCKAWVYRCGKYYILRSYSTFIAMIDTETDTLYDYLRWIYGYTSTSAQHISKFEHEYCAGNWRCSERLTYYYV